MATIRGIQFCTQNWNLLSCLKSMSVKSFQTPICIGNRMNASAFRDTWARVMFFKFSKLHEPQVSAI